MKIILEFLHVSWAFYDKSMYIYINVPLTSLIISMCCCCNVCTVGCAVLVTDTGGLKLCDCCCGLGTDTGVLLTGGCCFFLNESYFSGWMTWRRRRTKYKINFNVVSIGWSVGAIRAHNTIDIVSFHWDLRLTL